MESIFSVLQGGKKKWRARMRKYKHIVTSLTARDKNNEILGQKQAKKEKDCQKASPDDRKWIAEQAKIFRNKL